MTVAIKRVYESATRTDGTRLLVDRLWPRGLSKDQAAVDEWLRDLAPSNELRRWYHAKPNQWANFRKKYLKELSLPGAEDDLRRLYSVSRKEKRITLLFASKNEEQNNATVLKELLDGMRKPPVGLGANAVSGVRKRAAIPRK